VRHGIVILPQPKWSEARRYWSSAEGLGFDSAWTYDHLAWRSLAGEPWHATIPTLTAAATVTTDIRLGTFVASPNFRHPVPFAKELATLDDISGGRFQLGVGSGGTGFDAFVLGQQELSRRERHERFVEFVDGLDVLLRHEQDGGAAGGISFAGDWFTAVGARMVGTPAQTPRLPLMIAADGPKGIRLAAERGDGWITLGPHVEHLDEWWSGVADRIHRLEEREQEAGRRVQRLISLDAAPRFALESIDAFEDAEGRARELGFDEVVVHWPRPEGVYAGDEEVLFEVASRF
jgi:alkanesulfonate monooxygenase SsuD/methylene tetrahydromethanopterin reductase-like flavin-dependent oxidoreductase (luciferase family)